MIIQYGTSQQNNRNFEILELHWFVFPPLTINITSTQLNFLPSKSEIVSINFLIKFKNKLAESWWKFKNSQFQSKIYWL